MVRGREREDASTRVYITVQCALTLGAYHVMGARRWEMSRRGTRYRAIPARDSCHCKAQSPVAIESANNVIVEMKELTEIVAFNSLSIRYLISATMNGN